MTLDPKTTSACVEIKKRRAKGFLFKLSLKGLDVKVKISR